MLAAVADQMVIDELPGIAPVCLTKFGTFGLYMEHIYARSRLALLHCTMLVRRNPVIQPVLTARIAPRLV